MTTLDLTLIAIILFMGWTYYVAAKLHDIHSELKKLNRKEKDSGAK